VTRKAGPAKPLPGASRRADRPVPPGGCQFLSMSCRNLSILLAAFLAVAPAWAAELSWIPRTPEAIGRGGWASRDAPLVEVAYGPRAQASLGIELPLFELRSQAFTLRHGWWGLLALEDYEQDHFFPPHELWRGLVGVDLTLSLERWAQERLGAHGALELTLGLGHESDHATDRPNPFPPQGPEDIPNGGAGNHLLLQAAARAGRQPWRLSAALGVRRFADGDFRQGALGDLRLDRVLGARLEAFAAVHAEALQSSGTWRGVRRLRAMAGIALPGSAGRVCLFGALGAGNGYGLLVNRTGTELSAGVRLQRF
jgi:hypothetical protein